MNFLNTFYFKSSNKVNIRNNIINKLTNLSEKQLENIDKYINFTIYNREIDRNDRTINNNIDINDYYNCLFNERFDKQNYNRPVRNTKKNYIFYDDYVIPREYNKNISIKRNNESDLYNIINRKRTQKNNCISKQYILYNDILIPYEDVYNTSNLNIVQNNKEINNEIDENNNDIITESIKKELEELKNDKCIYKLNKERKERNKKDIKELIKKYNLDIHYEDSETENENNDINENDNEIKEEKDIKKENIKIKIEDTKEKVNETSNKIFEKTKSNLNETKTENCEIEDSN